MEKKEIIELINLWRKGFVEGLISKNLVYFDYKERRIVLKKEKKSPWHIQIFENGEGKIKSFFLNDNGKNMKWGKALVEKAADIIYLYTMED